MAHDKIYSHPQPVLPFEFNERVVEVFDDMIGRSVPLYRESLLRQAQLARKFYQPGTRIYDLGCSHGNFGIELLRQMEGQPFELQAVDSSAPMLEQYRQRLEPLDGGEHIHLHLDGIEEITLENASVIVINLTLQFLAPELRTALLQRIFNALCPGGILLLSEKVIHADTDLDALEQECYYRFKKENGYSQLEISQKREALENVLIPETCEQHLARLQQVGFSKIDIWLKWFNFMSMLCLKK
ncbi:MAG: carboxy-S-adenosyl-L-methionine synthase CmoA [Desulfuromonas sp.]|mgnify:CR=1 FL=1|nr:MAG: carboxy-S-adenosyl-L-methionine synthase CmoA [Desulfuromonas sp.]